MILYADKLLHISYDVDYKNFLWYKKHNLRVAFRLQFVYVHSEREIFLLPEIEEILERQRRQTGDGERIFPYDKNNVSHYFKKYCPNHKLHDLRHTFVTRCAESGININVAQRLAGHSDINTTLQIYTHVTTDFQRSEFKKFKI